MRLSAKILDNVSSINHWNYSNEAHVYEGQVNEIYFQLVDLSKTVEVNGVIGQISDYPMRYIPQGSVVSVSLEFDSIDDSEVFTVNATQPFSDDKSIWKASISASQLPKTGNFKLTLTEDGVSKSVIVKSSIIANLYEVGGC